MSTHKPTLVATITRPPAELVRQFSLLPAANVADAIGKPCTMTLSPMIAPAYTGIRLCGTAVTVREGPDCNLMSHAAIDHAQAGDVLVIDAQGYTGTATGGFLMSRKMIARRLAGVVIDGAWRDRTEVTEAEFPVYCRAWTPGGPHKNQPGSVNVPVSCGGVIVHPGDIILGDDDGVVVVPQAEAPAVLRRAQEINAREEATISDNREEVLLKPSTYATYEKLKALGVEIK